MDHYCSMPVTVLSNVVDVEPLGQVKVELDRRPRPLATEGVDPFDIDFRTVKRATALVQFVFDAALLQRIAERFDCAVPRALIADPLVRSRSKICLEVITKLAGHVCGQVNYACDLIDHLLFRAEYVSVILREAADTQ